MRIDKEDLVRAFDKALREFGFRRKGLYWYSVMDETVRVVNLQKSNYSKLYYVNIGIYYPTIDGKNEFPKEDQCHLRTRLDNNIVNSKKDFDFLFDLENKNLNKASYEKEIEECVQKNIIPQLAIIGSREGILGMIEKDPTVINTIPLRVKSYLNL